jgi:hypothetical protein
MEDISYIIANQLKSKVLVDWIEYIDWNIICSNYNAIDMIFDNLDKINQKSCCYLILNKNPKVIDIVEIFLDKLDRECKYLLCRNENAYRLIKKIVNFNNIENHYLSDLCRNKNPKIANIIIKKYLNSFESLEWCIILSNPAFIDVILDNFNVCFENEIFITKNNVELYVSDILYYLTKNSSEKIIPILDKNIFILSSINWNNICSSKNKIILNFVEKHLDHLRDFNLSYLLSNTSATEIIIRHFIDLINNDNYIEYFCLHPNLTHILEKKVDKFINHRCWLNLCENPNSYEILKNNINKVSNQYCISKMCRNTNPIFLNLIKNNITKINKLFLLKNPNIFIDNDVEFVSKSIYKNILLKKNDI